MVNVYVLMDIKEKIVADVKFLMELFKMEFLHVIKDGMEYFVTKKIVKMIVLEMDIARMEFVIVIIHIVETIVS